MQPKFKEDGYDRARRMALGKPHIYWSRWAGEWLYQPSGGAPEPQARRFCEAQDKRWTPRRAK